MARTLIFKPTGEVVSLDDDYVKEGKGDVVWMHLSPKEHVVEAIVREIGQDEDFREDFLEEQRPRLADFKSFTVVVFSVPSKAELVQLSFIISRDKLISVASAHCPAVESAMERLEREKAPVTPTRILSEIIEEGVEESISLLEEQGKTVDSLELSVLKGERPDQAAMQDLRVGIYYNSKMFRADIEVVKEILSGKGEFIKKKHFEPNIEDRLLFAADAADTLKESVANVSNMHLTAITYRTNESMHKLTMLGAVLLVPAVIASLFGMNVPLPGVGFWEVIAASLALSAALWVLLRKVRWV